MTKFLLKMVHNPKILILFVLTLFFIVFFILAPFFHFFDIIQMPFNKGTTSQFKGVIIHHVELTTLITLAIVAIFFITCRNSIAIAEDKIESAENS